MLFERLLNLLRAHDEKSHIDAYIRPVYPVNTECVENSGPSAAGRSTD